MGISHNQALCLVRLVAKALDGDSLANLVAYLNHVFPEYQWRVNAHPGELPLKFNVRPR